MIRNALTSVLTAGWSCMARAFRTLPLHESKSSRRFSKIFRSLMMFFISPSKKVWRGPQNAAWLPLMYSFSISPKACSVCPTLIKADPYGVPGPNSFPASIMSVPRYSRFVNLVLVTPSLSTGMLSNMNVSSLAAVKEMVDAIREKSFRKGLKYVFLTRIGYKDGLCVLNQFFRVSLDFVRLFTQIFKGWIVFCPFGFAQPFLCKLFGSAEHGFGFIINMSVLKCIGID